MAQQYMVQDNNHVVKGYFRSAAVLWRGIMHFLYAGLYIGLYLAAAASARDIILIVDSGNSLNETLKIYDTVQIGGLAASITALIPFILVAVAYIIIFAKSRNDSVQSRPDSGITILNVFAILELIGAIIATVSMIFVAVMTFITETKRVHTSAVSEHYDYVPLIVSLVAIGISAAVILSIAIVYKLYIGSISKTARTTGFYYRGAKAFGVFSVIRAICAGFSVLSAIGALIVFKRLPEWFGTSGTDQQISNYIADRGLVFFILLTAATIVVFVIYILDAKIALGYNRYARQTEQSKRRYIDDTYQGDYQQPPENAYYSSYNPDDDRTYAEPQSGYGDSYSDGDDR